VSKSFFIFDGHPCPLEPVFRNFAFVTDTHVRKRGHFMRKPGFWVFYGHRCPLNRTIPRRPPAHIVSLDGRPGSICPAHPANRTWDENCTAKNPAEEPRLTRPPCTFSVLPPIRSRCPAYC